MKILSGVFEGRTTGTPISLLIENEDQRSKDYSEIKEKFRPGHADFSYWAKYGIRDYRGGGRSSARETASRVAAGAVARKVIEQVTGRPVDIHGALVQIGNADGDVRIGCVSRFGRSQQRRDGNRHFFAPTQPLCEMSKMMPLGSRNFIS